VSDRGSAAIRNWLAAVPERRRPDSLLIPRIQAETDAVRGWGIEYFPTNLDHGDGADFG